MKFARERESKKTKIVICLTDAIKTAKSKTRNRNSRYTHSYIPHTHTKPQFDIEPNNKTTAPKTNNLPFFLVVIYVICVIAFIVMYDISLSREQKSLFSYFFFRAFKTKICFILVYFCNIITMFNNLMISASFSFCFFFVLLFR